MPFELIRSSRLRALLVTALALLAALLAAPSAHATFAGRDGALALEQSDYSDSGTQFDNPAQSDARLRLFSPGVRAHTVVSCTGGGSSDTECDAGADCPAPDSSHPICLDLGRPAFSPDGRAIAFADDLCRGAFCRRLALVGADGTGETMLPALTADDAQPAFLASGGLVFAGRATRGATQNLFTVERDGSRLMRLTSAGGAEPAPCADGAIVYVFHSELWLMSADHRVSRRLTFRGGARPECAPDGRTIAFLRHGDVYLIPRTGTGLRRVTFSGGVSGPPAFSPDGRLLAFAAQHRASKVWPPHGSGEFENAYLQVVDLRGRPARKPVLLGTSGADQDTFGYGTSVGGIDWQPLGGRAGHAVRASSALPATGPPAPIRPVVSKVALVWPGATHADAAVPLRGALAWSAARKLNLPGTLPMLTVACPSATQCTTVDSARDAITFDPRRSGVSTTIPVPGSGVGVGVVSLACPTAGQCTAVEVGGSPYAGHAVTFDPATGVELGPAVALPGYGQVACPSATQCTVADEIGRDVVTFEPRSGASFTQIVPTTAGYDLRGLSCASSTLCVVTDIGHDVYTVDPRAPGVLARFVLPGAAFADGIACPSATQCTALTDAASSRYARVTTFDPRSPQRHSVLRLSFDTFAAAVACPTTTRCVAASATGETFSFNPRTGRRGASRRLHQSLDIRDPIACPTAEQCTVAGTGAVTFDPRASRGPLRVRRDPVARLVGVACPVMQRCTAVARGGLEVTFAPHRPSAATFATIDPGGGLTAVACPNARQCTAVDARGRELTFNPRSPGRPPVTREDRYAGLIALACPSARQCTAIAQDGAVVTFDSRTGRRQAAGRLGPQSPLFALACPSLRECVAVGSGAPPSADRDVRFNPLAPSARDGAVLDRLGAFRSLAPTGLACPSTRACVLVDAAGGEIGFDPRTREHTPRLLIDSGVPLVAVACTSTHACVAVDGQGHTLRGDPASGGPWTIDRIAGAGALTAVACPAGTECVVVDAGGDEAIS